MTLDFDPYDIASELLNKNIIEMKELILKRIVAKSQNQMKLRTHLYKSGNKYYDIDENYI